MSRLVLAAFLLVFPLSGLAQSGANPTDPYIELVKRVQERLHAHGYDIGPVDGMLDMRTQRAVAQFQLSQNLPAGGALDDETLKALGVDTAEWQTLRAEAESAAAGDSAPAPSK